MLMMAEAIPSFKQEAGTLWALFTHIANTNTDKYSHLQLWALTLTYMLCNSLVTCAGCTLLLILSQLGLAPDSPYVQ